MREFLKGLELDKETIDTIMAEHGKLVTAFKEEIETLKTGRADITPAALKKLNSELESAQRSLKEFEGVDVAKLRQQIADAAGKLDSMTAEHKAKVDELTLDALVRENLAKISFSSGYARQGVYNEVKETVKLEDGRLAGFDEAVAAIREKQPAAFASTETTQPKSESKPHKNQTPPPAVASLRDALAAHYGQKPT